MTLTGCETDLTGGPTGWLRAGRALGLALALLLLDGGVRAEAAAITGDVAASSTPADRLTRGPAFATADVMTAAPGALSRPAFDPSAGVFGHLDIEPTLAPPQTLGSSATVMPIVREALSSSVAATDLFTDAPVGLGLAAPYRDERAFSAASTVAVIGLGDAGRVRRTAGLERGADLAPAGHPVALTRSSVFVDPATEPAAGQSARTMTGLTTVQRRNMLTLYQALREPAAANPSIDGYALSAPSTATADATPAALLQLPIRVSSSYGFLTSSLTVFSDDSGSFSGIGQSFNGLLALNMAEPASLAVVAASLVGLAVLRRRRLRG